MKIKFGTGGWRAVIGDDFIRENIEKVGQAVSEVIIEENKQDIPVVIGYDHRFLSKSAAEWLASVLCGNGIKVLALKRSAPTPLIMHMVKTYNLFCGLEVTASHNPPEYDGIKIIVEEGRDASIEQTDRVEKVIEKVTEIKHADLAEAKKTGLFDYIRNPFNRFIDDILSMLDVESIRNRGLRILFDPMHGSGTYPLMTVLYTARCTVDMINQNKDAYFGDSMPAPTADSIRELGYKVKKGKYDLGIAFDGDGDRLGIVDEKGDYIDANQILSMLYWYLHEYKGWKGPVVRNIATTHVLDRIAESFGEECYEVPVGFKYISSKIDETDAVLGGESSGGLTVRGHIHGKDSVYAASLFVEMLSATGKTVGEILKMLGDKYGKTVFADYALPFLPENREKVLSLLNDGIPDFENVKTVNRMDGCKVVFEDDSFVICRPSGTEPIIRIMAEAPCKKIADEYIKKYNTYISSI